MTLSLIQTAKHKYTACINRVFTTALSLLQILGPLKLKLKTVSFKANLNCLSNLAATNKFFQSITDQINNVKKLN